MSYMDRGVLVQLQVSRDLISAMEVRLSALQVLDAEVVREAVQKHVRDWQTVVDKIPMAQRPRVMRGGPCPRQSLNLRVPNLIRACIALGLKHKDKELLAAIAEAGLSIGRPKGT